MGNLSPVVIAIDGPSASGKGTIARKLAAHFDFAHLDTGLLYRAVGFAVISAGGEPSDPELAEQAALALALQLSGQLSNALPTAIENRAEAILASIDFLKLMNDDVLRLDTASVAASKVAAVPVVRGALLKFQKEFCLQPPNHKKGAVLDGRDIGTIIAPQATVKLFVTANMQARAFRRLNELHARGENAMLEDIVQDMENRDRRDAERATAPTKAAADAHLLDTTDLSAQQAFDTALAYCKLKLHDVSA